MNDETGRVNADYARVEIGGVSDDPLPVDVSPQVGWDDERGRYPVVELAAEIREPRADTGVILNVNFSPEEARALADQLVQAAERLEAPSPDVGEDVNDLDD